jgi:hypothetical protein
MTTESASRHTVIESDDIVGQPTAEPPTPVTAPTRAEIQAKQRAGTGGTRQSSHATGPEDAATANIGSGPWAHRLIVVGRITGYYLASRLALAFAVLVVKWLFPKFTVVNSLGAGWDGGWYTRIARYGYPHALLHEAGGSRWGFFPALPAIERAVVEVTRVSYPAAGLIVALAFGWASAIAVWLAVREVFGSDVADRSVLLYLFFPISFVLSMGYTEGLFIATSAFCLFALSRRYWLTAAGFAIAASLTRSFGVILIVAVVVICGLALRSSPRARPLLAILLAPLGFIGWMVYAWRMTGTPLAFVKAESFWGDAHFVWLTTPFQSVRHLATGSHAWTVAPDVLAALALVVMVAGLVLLAIAHRSGVRLPAAWWIYTVLTVLAAMSPFWPTSVLRYSLAAFPMFAAFAWRLRGTWFTSLVAVCALAQGALAVMLLVGLVHPQATPLAP